jgi:hypothetical protein
MYLKRTMLCSSLLGLAASMLLAAPPTMGAVKGDSAKASALLVDAKAGTMELRNAADALDRFTRSDVTWDSYVVVLDQVKEQVNQTGKIVTKLIALRDECSPWQVEAIGKILPAVNQLATDTEILIKRLNENQALAHTPSFRVRASENAVLAGKLADVVASYADYAKGKIRVKEPGKPIS